MDLSKQPESPVRLGSFVGYLEADVRPRLLATYGLGIPSRVRRLWRWAQRKKRVSR